jgi:hypothetical protein
VDGGNAGTETAAGRGIAAREFVMKPGFGFGGVMGEERSMDTSYFAHYSTTNISR